MAGDKAHGPGPSVRLSCIGDKSHRLMEWLGWEEILELIRQHCVYATDSPPYMILQVQKLRILGWTQEILSVPCHGFLAGAMRMQKVFKQPFPDEVPKVHVIVDAPV